ncbi:hypothetical protein PHLGIDRAFT_10397 [Phlebiopsis gigantea 11061_1 CR5-6]|uniref:BHLH domain-containing protein n=1 Tax=Phlebiopsis gigantea (strain 11061_1 CR5-6) TaxID=745531 RepID=A0A0C3PVG7_PHLG1|nr:hypothetical protein PHLGIDRAFT_10397 [Phlebiopsis gigantea 11061_1 CR5-6]
MASDVWIVRGQGGQRLIAKAKALCGHPRASALGIKAPTPELNAPSCSSSTTTSSSSTTVTLMTSIYSNYKPHRQEGFHLPSPAPSTPPSSDGTPANSSSFDAHNLFISPPSYLSVPETFRKFPPPEHSAGTGGGSNMDFSDELASLISQPPSSHERSTQSPVSPYDDYRPSTTHNIFDISAPTSHHQHSSNHGSYGTPGAGGGANAFSLPPSSSLPMHTPTHPLHDFATHAHFNSTVPAIGSSMRYEPPPSSHGHSQNAQSHPFALNTSSSSNGNASHNGNGAEPSSVSSFNSHMSSLSALSNFSSNTTTTAATNPNDFLRHTPSPSANEPPSSSHGRSRSRSRSSMHTSSQPQPPPSTNGGPTRRTRPKRGSISSVSPPPLHRGHITQPLIIPPSSASGQGSARSPLGMHGSGWFHPGSGLGTSLPGVNSMHHGLGSLQTNMGIGAMGEFSLPTPDSVHGGFAAFGGGLPPIGISGSPKELGMGMGGLPNGKSDSVAASAGPVGDTAAKQAAIANEKRRRRRESHNAVERRRRDNINEKISELATLIPECLLDPNATMTMPASLSSATSEDLLLGNTAPLSPTLANSPTEESVTKKEEADDKESEAAGIIKANKGMILRKSVEYIRYLQQLVSAQASRNRDLEQQLQSIRVGKGGIDGDNGSLNEDEMLTLHDEDDLSLSLGLNGSAPANGMNGHRARRMSSSQRSKKFNGFELDTVAEMETDHDEFDYSYHRHGLRDEDQDMERPGTAGTGMGASPLSGGSASDENENDAEDGDARRAEREREEEERGRKGRDGRPMGSAGVVMKTEEGMETS